MNHETLVRAGIICKKILSKISIKYTVLEIQFRSLKSTLLVGYAKISSNFPLSFKQCKAFTVCRCKRTTSKSFQTYLYCIYLFKLYDTSIITLLGDDLTNSCSKISKIWLILGIYYTCNVKGLEEVEKMGKKWTCFASLTKIIRDERYY